MGNAGAVFSDPGALAGLFVAFPVAAFIGCGLSAVVSYPTAAIMLLYLAMRSGPPDQGRKGNRATLRT